MPELELPDPIDFIPYTIPWWQSTISWILRYPEVMLHRVNSIVDLFEWNCGGNVLTYVRLALPAAGELVMSMLSIEWDDVLRGFLKGAGIRSRSKMFGGIGKSKFSLEIPEIGEEIGQRLPLAGKLRGTRLGKGLKWIFKADAVIQRTLWYFVITDMVSEFLFDWSSNIIRAEECRGGGVYVRGGEYGIPGEPHTQTVPLQGPDTEVIATSSDDGAIRLAGNTIIAERQCALVSSVYGKGWFPRDTWMRYRTYWVNASGVPFGYGPVGDTRHDDTNDSTQALSFIPPGQYELRFEVLESNTLTGMLGINVVAAK